MRGVGITDALTGVVPDALLPLLRVLTALGDPVLFMAVAPALYWFGPRYGLLTPVDAARLLGVVVGGLALVVALKNAFALPRPPASVALVTTDGYGFPSGHATGSTVFYGALAALSSVGTRRQRYGAAAAVVAVVACTRVALGVHYALDVVVGATVGSAYVALALAASDRRPEPAFALAVVSGVAAFALAGTAESAIAFGATLGGLVGWWDVRDRLDRFAARGVRGVVALCLFLGVGALPLAAEPWPPLAVGAGAIMGIGVVSGPGRL